MKTQPVSSYICCSCCQFNSTHLSSSETRFPHSTSLYDFKFVCSYNNSLFEFVYSYNNTLFEFVYSYNNIFEFVYSYNHSLFEFVYSYGNMGSDFDYNYSGLGFEFGDSFTLKGISKCYGL